MIEAAILVIFPFAMAFAIVSDLLSMTIENRVSLILAGSFAILAPLTGMGWEIYALHFAAGFAVLTATFCLFAIRAMGGGDAKLMAATALWLGWNIDLIHYLATASILGGMLTLAILAYRGSPFTVLAGRFEFMDRLAQQGTGVPYGIALGAAGLLTFPQSPLGGWVLAKLSIL
ncbi:A24 family peptidase [Phyllobacterium leguminum]|uniref:Prepilin peptidase CpaA n=1 Tax=Phyllobacterium leguminum TaxID=314237 RepID=A0A318T512_9HYPH|nr:prepilin peptidase [Phyllobacterium leguminum]PYE89244.1 prepilin peptidase CpaA [Phyllobacterium leguminum]